GPDHRQRAEPLQPGRPAGRARAGLLPGQRHRVHPLVPRRVRRPGPPPRPTGRGDPPPPPHHPPPARPRPAAAALPPHPAHPRPPAELALAWLLRRSPFMLPTPGTSSVAHLEENCAAADLTLTDEEYDALTAAA